MQLNKIQNEFLGCMSAVVVENNEQFMKLKEFLGINNLFLSDGTPAAQLNLNIEGKRVAFYRDELGMFVGYDHPANIGTNYAIHEFNEAFNEQISLFGNDDAGIVKSLDKKLIADDPMEEAVIDTDVKEVINEISLKEALNQLEIGTVTPARCDGNLLQIKDKVVEIVKKKENIIVTKDNFIEMKEVVTDLNGKARALKAQRAEFNNEINKFSEPYSKAFTEIISALESVSKSINTNIKVYEDEEKDAQKKKIYEETIDPTLNMLVDNGMIDEDIKSQFKFCQSWLNKSAVTDTGNLRKKTKDEINNEFERLVSLYDQKKKDIATIDSTIKQLSIAHNLDDEALKADTYIELYKKGTPMPKVQERINHDIEMIKKTVEKEVEKKAQELASQQQNIKQVQQVQTIKNETVTEEYRNYGTSETVVDDKTGELYAKGDSSKIVALVIQTPEKYAEKTFTYTYTFSGSFGAIKTFSNILKLLSKIFEDFKYEKVGK